MKIHKALFLTALVLVCMGIGCRKSAIDQSKIEYEKFSNYITGYSQSPVSRCEDIYVNLGFAIPLTTSIPTNLFEVSPPVGGTYEVSPDRERIILRNPDIKHNLAYTVKFNIGLITEMPPNMKSFSFPLEAQVQSWDITVNPPVNNSMDNVTYTGSVKFGVCEPVPQVLETSLVAIQGSEKLVITWDHKKRQERLSTFTIRNIKRTDDPGSVDLTLSMEAINVKDKANLKLAIPSKSDFSMHSYGIINNQHLEITFTDPLLNTQTIDGLIKVKDRVITQIKIVKNKVSVFFQNENYGYFDLTVLPGIKNEAGYMLKDSYTKELFFRPPSPQVRIAEKGNILPPGDKWELPVSLVSASGFRLRLLKVYDHNIPRFYQENADPYNAQSGLENLGRIALDTIIKVQKERPFIDSYHSVALDRVIRKESGALYKVLLTIPEEHNVYPCQVSDGKSQIDMIDAIDFDKPWARMRYNYDYYDDNYYEGDYYHSGNLGGNYYAEEFYKEGHQNPCNKSYAAQIFDARLLMCTDIGLVAKYEAEKKSFFFFSSLISTSSPISSANIELFNVQGRKIAEGYTDSNGMVDIGLKDEKAFLAKATHNNQTTYLQIQDSKALSLSTFQVEGENWEGPNKVFFYGDRDVWRPGDTCFVNSIVFSPEKHLPESLPVQLSLFDPSNKIVKTWTVKSNLDGIYNCQFSTDIDDPTGYWRMEMKLGGKTYKTPIRIETIRPNRLKMEMTFAAEKLLKASDSRSAPVTVKWMHGLEAKSLKTEVTMLQKSLINPFGSDYTNYVFDDVRKSYNHELGLVGEGSTDSKGTMQFEIPIEEMVKYPSMMQFNFELRAFEPGGAFSTDMKAIKYAPYSHYIGAKFPGGGAGQIIQVKDTEAIMLASLDQSGRPAQRKVRVKVSKLDYNWWYQFGTKGNYSAMSNYVTNVVEDYEVTVGKAGKSISLKHFGRLMIEIADLESGHSISRVVYSYSENWRDENEEVSQLEVLPLLIEKTEYSVGDQIEFDLPAMQKGRYLITLENGGQIVYKETRASQSTPSKMYIAVTAEMAPTAYIHVHLIQAWDQHSNDRPLRLFGIKPIKVYDENTILNPRITMQDGVKTDEAFTIQITEENSKGMSYTLALVDEGLLDITQFKTPDPWSVFFGKEGLNVKTWDMYREIFKRFLGEYTSMLAVGGDGSNTIKPTAKAQRFKPVVKFVGPFKLNPGETKSHSFKIENYAGSVRAMVVATNGNALGRYEKTVPVTKPLILYATLPRVIGPKETLKLPVTVFTMENSIKNVTATLKTSDNIKVIGDHTQTIVFEKKGEKDIYFAIETGEALGISEVVVEVTSGEYNYKETIQLDLRASSPRISKSYNTMIAASKTGKIDYQLLGMPGTNDAKVTVSKGLNFAFAPQVDWLSSYPHGCLEQTISSIFPQIYLYKMQLLDEVDQLKYKQQYKAAIQKLRFLQMPNGGFSYWPGGNIANEWGTTYAFQFLLEAKQYGYEVPEDMISKCITYQYKTSENVSILSTGNDRPTSNFYTIGQAYKLYTLAQAGKPNYAAMNRLRLLPNLHNTAKWILAHSFTLLGEDKLATSMMDSATSTTEEYRELGGNFGSRLRDQALIARVLIDRKDRLMAKEVIDEMLTNFDAGNVARLSTQDRAQALITFAMFVSSLDKVEESLVYDIVLSDTQAILDTELRDTPQTYILDDQALKNQLVSISNKGDSELYTTLVTTGQPLRDESKADTKNLTLGISYTDASGNKINPEQIEKGMDFVIEYTLVHDGIRDNFENLALTAIFPSGWEILNQRLNENSTFDAGDKVDYQDIRDDRIHLYFDLNKKEKKVFRLKMNATYEGKYWAPPAYCEAMYDANIRAKTKGFWAVVK